jgi:hypothetical protein
MLLRATGLAGFPCTIVRGGTWRDTTLPAVTTAPCPIVTSGRITAFGPMNTSSSIRTETSSGLNGSPVRRSMPLYSKCATIVTRMPIATRFPITTRRGKPGSIIVPRPSQVPSPISTPRRRCSQGRTVSPPGACSATACRRRAVMSGTSARRMASL